MIISPETCDKFRFGREETQKLLQKLKDDVNGLKKHKKLYFQHFFDDQQSNTTEFINFFQKILIYVMNTIKMEIFPFMKQS